MSSTPPDDLPAPVELLSAHAYRLKGIDAWERVPDLGKANLERLVQLSRETVQSLMAADASMAERRTVARAITLLQGYADAAPRKPLLPRLRVESFRKGEEVAVYLGDSEGSVAPTDWVRARITAVSKAHRPDWDDGSPNRGYFWRWTATAEASLFPGAKSVDFSTSEPRVLPLWEFEYLRRSPSDDPAFLDVYAASADRPWCPLWCLERGAPCAGEAMDMRLWLGEGTGP